MYEVVVDSKQKCWSHLFLSHSQQRSVRHVAGQLAEHIVETVSNVFELRFLFHNCGHGKKKSIGHVCPKVYEECLGFNKQSDVIGTQSICLIVVSSMSNLNQLNNVQYLLCKICIMIVLH